MTADMINHAIAGIGFIHALGRLFVCKGLAACTNTFMTQKRARRHDQYQGRIPPLSPKFDEDLADRIVISVARGC